MINIYKNVLLILFCSALVLPLNAKTPAENDKFEELSHLLNTLNTFKASFKQSIFSEDGQKIDEVSGEIGIKKPNRFYWNVTAPFNQKLIADGKYLWQYDEDLEQATVRNLSESMGNTPAEILSGEVVNLNERYHLKMIQMDKKNKDQTGYQLVPVKDGQFESIQLFFKNNQLTRLILKDTLAQTTKVEFNHVETAIKLPDSLFLMVLPKGVEIVDSRVRDESADAIPEPPVIEKNK